MGEYIVRQNEFLVFEEGPSQDIKLQWASYRDASDQCCLSRIWGGIHPYIDDMPGRFIGSVVGVESFNYGAEYFESSLSTIDLELRKLKLVSNPIYSDQSIEIINTNGNETFKLYNINGQQIKINTFSPLSICLVKLPCDKNEYDLVFGITNNIGSLRSITESAKSTICPVL